MQRPVRTPCSALTPMALCLAASPGRIHPAPGRPPNQTRRDLP
jgi:hypothetical protein